MRTEMASIIGEASMHDLYGLKDKREAEIDFRLASLVLENYFRDDDGGQRPWLFPQLLEIARRWRQQCLTLKDNAFPQLLLFTQFANEAADRIYHAIVASRPEDRTLKPILRPYDTLGSTRYVDFDTIRPTYRTDPAKCHISHVVADTGSWEQKMASVLEEMDEVVAYAKNQNLGFTIPYTLDGEEHGYLPDFLVKIDDGLGAYHRLHLILEVSGEARKDKAAKAATARTLWVPAINNHGGFGRWAFIEISDPWDAKNTIRAMLGTGGAGD
jgi:type III restriction enzyme